MRLPRPSIEPAILLPSALLLAGACLGAEAPTPGASRFAAVGCVRRTIYHSPQTPGYTCWVGAWQMPDKSLMVTFKQATGPLTGRPRSLELLRQMGLSTEDPGRDFTGLSLANVYLRSTDGSTWEKVAEEAFPGPLDRPSWGGSHVALRDGSILRAVDGSQLPLVPDLPRRIYFQRSADLGKTWGPPILPPEPRRPGDLLGDYGDCISRVRRLRDGRLLATGVSRYPDRKRVSDPVLMVSDDEGKTWVPRLEPVPDAWRGPRTWNEWDTAEIPGGDLLGVFRTRDPENPSRQVRYQGLFRKKGEGWVLERYGPSVLAHSGHPELLATREGIVLHVATEGIHWTDDAGAAWHPLPFAGQQAPYRSRYYPRSLQTDDGRIYVFSHLGWDNAYGAVDQAIVMDAFRVTAP